MMNRCSIFAWCLAPIEVDPDFHREERIAGLASTNNYKTTLIYDKYRTN